MKTRVLIASLIVTIAAVLAHAAYTKQNTRVPSLHIDTTFNGGTGSAITVKTYAYLENVLVNDSDPNDVIPPPRRVVAFDLLDNALNGQTITAAGAGPITYPQLAALLRQAALDQANAQGQP